MCVLSPKKIFFDKKEWNSLNTVFLSNGISIVLLSQGSY